MPASWRRRQKEALGDALYRTSLELFAEHGYQDTTVQQITERVGVAKGTFFNHFPSKEHVIAAWYDGITKRCLKAARERDARPAEAAIAELCADMARMATSTPELFLAKAQNSAHPSLIEAERIQNDETDAFLLVQCRAGQERGELSPDLDVAFFAGLLGDLLTGTSRAWIASRSRFDFPAEIRRRIRFVFHAARRAER